MYCNDWREGDQILNNWLGKFQKGLPYNIILRVANYCGHVQRQ